MSGIRTASNPTLLIVGASARAAAGSAIRAGFSPWCADLYADVDLRLIAPATRCPFNQYPRRLIEVVRMAPESPWIYTGALENHPRLIDELSRLRPLIGNGPSAIRDSRSPFFVAKVVREAGLPAPEVRRTDENLAASGRWLLKPFASAAGSGIAFADARIRMSSKRHYLQEFIDGESLSAVFVRQAGKTIFLGATEQFIGTDWLNALPFHYAGNIGPVEVSLDLKRDLQLAGDVIGDHCGLSGVFGVDFILHGGRPWIVEVNPRYTASVEVLEFATGLRALASQCDSAPPARSVFGKAIWYAPQRVVMPEYRMEPGTFGMRLWFAGQSKEIECADIPSPGDGIEPGWPVMTLFANAATREESIAKLRRSADCVRQSICRATSA